MKKYCWVWVLLVAVIAGLLTAGVGASAPDTRLQAGETADNALVVVASTSWTGLMARAAGAGNVTVLAPLELKHPPEYDYRPSDIARVVQADYVVWGGYEPFIKKLVQAAEIPENKLLQVMTMNRPDNLKKETRKLAAIFGTQADQDKWEKEFDKLVARMQKAAVEKNVAEKRVLVHFHQQAFVRWLGYEVVGVFGPEEMSPARVAKLGKLSPDLVIDNYHNPLGKGIAEIAGADYVELINFPGKGINSLDELLAENARRLGLLD